MLRSPWSVVFILLAHVWIVFSLEVTRQEPSSVWSTLSTPLGINGVGFSDQTDQKVTICGTQYCAITGDITDTYFGCLFHSVDVQETTLCIAEVSGNDKDGKEVKGALLYAVNIVIPELNYMIPTRVPVNMNSTVRIALKHSFGINIAMKEVFINGITTTVVETNPAYLIVRLVDGSEPTSVNNITIVAENGQYLSTNNAEIITYQTKPTSVAISAIEPSFIVQSGRAYTIGYIGQNQDRILSIYILDSTDSKKYPCYIVSKDDINGKYVTCMLSSSRQMHTGIHKVYLYLKENVAMVSELQVLPEPKYTGLQPSKCPVNNDDCVVKSMVIMPNSVPFAIRLPNSVYVTRKYIDVTQTDISFPQICKESCSGAVSMVSNANYNGVETQFLGKFDSLAEATLPGFTDILPRMLSFNGMSTQDLYGYNLGNLYSNTTRVLLTRDSSDGKYQAPLSCSVAVQKSPQPIMLRVAIPESCFLVQNCKNGVYVPSLEGVAMDKQVPLKITVARPKSTGILFRLALGHEYESKTALLVQRNVALNIGQQYKIDPYRLAGAGIAPLEYGKCELMFYILDIDAWQEQASNQAEKLKHAILYQEEWVQRMLGNVIASPSTFGYEKVSWCDATETYSKECVDRKATNGLWEILVIVSVITVGVLVLGLSVWCYLRRLKRTRRTDKDIVVPLFGSLSSINQSD